MGTRIQDKSRPTKRPQAKASGGSYTTVASGKPKTDLKGYPATDGIPAPVLVNDSGVDPAPPAGTVPLGTWRVGDETASGEFSAVAALLVNDIDNSGADQSAVLLALTTGDTVWFKTTTGSNTLTVDTVTDSTGFVTIAVSGQIPVGVIHPNQPAAFWVTAP